MPKGHPSQRLRWPSVKLEALYEPKIRAVCSNPLVILGIIYRIFEPSITTLFKMLYGKTKGGLNLQLFLSQ